MATWNTLHLSGVRSGFRIDSEFYKDEYIQQDYKLSGLKCSALGQLAKVTDGEHGSVSFVANGIKYLTAENVKQGFVDFEGVRFVDSRVDQKNARARVNVGDILISIKGTLGQVGVAESNLLPANMNRDVAIIKPFQSSPSGYYIAAFLRSSYGTYQLAREGSGGVQQMITLERLRDIKIPILAEDSIASIAYEYKLALQKRNESILIYAEAQQLLESELRLCSINFVDSVDYTANFSELSLSKRNDAQHYQPCFVQMLEHIARFPTKRIREICLHNRRGVQPVYVKNGNYLVVNSQHLGSNHIHYDKLERTTLSDFNASPQAHIQLNDLLIYTTGAYVGRTNAYLNTTPALASNHVNILRLTPEIDHAYMAMVFQSIIGQFQTQKHARGSAQAELYPADIDKFIVPILLINFRFTRYHGVSLKNHEF